MYSTPNLSLPSSRTWEVKRFTFLVRVKGQAHEAYLTTAGLPQMYIIITIIVRSMQQDMYVVRLLSTWYTCIVIIVHIHIYLDLCFPSSEIGNNQREEKKVAPFSASFPVATLPRLG